MPKATARNRNSYNKLFDEIIKVINNNIKCGEFYLRDTIPNPPMLLGNWLFKEVNKGKYGRLPNIVHVGKDSTGTHYYKKVK